LNILILFQETAAENVFFCIENDLGMGEYRNANKMKKLPAAVRKLRNQQNLVEMAKRMINQRISK
jgi:hypothetical protein